MLKYVVNRLLSLIPVILVTSFLIYWAMSLTELPLRKAPPVRHLRRTDFGSSVRNYTVSCDKV